MSSLFECPKCGKHTLVEREHDLFQCLACDFKRDLSKADAPPPSNDLPWIFFILFIVVFVMAADPVLNATPKPAQPLFPAAESMG